MDSTPEASLKGVKEMQKDVLHLLELESPPFATVEDLMKKHRSVCENVIFQDFGSTTSNQTDDELWKIHGQINTKYRRLLTPFRQRKSKESYVAVQRRKLEAHYTAFIKSSMRHYRGYIQRIASHFAGIPEVLQVAQNLRLDTLSVEPPVTASLEMKQNLIKSCYTTIIRLGDLSRYRETELEPKTKNWGPAKGYYDLATTLQPKSGHSWNGLAAIALVAIDHIRIIYYLYRALSVENPFPSASKNLSVEFKDIRNRHSKPLEAAGQSVSNLFATLHASCYYGDLFEDHDDLSNEVLSLIASDLREKPADRLVRKMCLINIAAAHYAKSRVRKPEKNDRNPKKSLISLHQLNVTTFFTLLQVLVSELERPSENEAAATLSQDFLRKLTPAVRHTLPHLRQYSSWLLGNVEMLLLPVNEMLVVQSEELWKLYVQALNLLTICFPVEKLPNVEYLLEEDYDTVAFTPFSAEICQRRYKDRSGFAKPSPPAQGGYRSSSYEEMLSRIRDFVEDGRRLANVNAVSNLKGVPISIVGDQFAYDNGDMGEISPSQARASHTHTHSTTSVTREEVEIAKQARLDAGASRGTARNDYISISASTSVQMSTAMQDMVEDLVESEDSDDLPVAQLNEPPPQTPTMPTVSNSHKIQTSRSPVLALTAQDLVRQMQRPASRGQPITSHDGTLPFLPSIWNTAFTPRPGETSSSRPSTSHRISQEHVAFGAMHPRSSTGLFREAIAQQQQELEQRSSPSEMVDMSSWIDYETPTIMRAVDPPGFGSSWNVGLSGHQYSSLESDALPRSAQRIGLFGAVGQVPKGHTPTSGQPG